MLKIEVAQAQTPPLRHGMASHCEDCPGAVRGQLRSLPGGSVRACGFEGYALHPRAQLPADWNDRYRLGLVRRGYLIRQRIDASGCAVAIDALGPGCAFPLELPSGQDTDGQSSGYSVGHLLLCMCDQRALEHGLRAGGESALDIDRLHRQALSRMERLAEARGRPNAVSKLAALLCSLADTLSTETSPEPRIPAELLQRDLAALLSIRHESVCRTLRGFIDARLVERNRRGLILLDRERLAAL